MLRVLLLSAWLTGQSVQASNLDRPIVAVIDTGADIQHPKIRGSIWRNESELSNGIDDDGNGYIDDLSGWNFAANSTDISDTHGHGTHIAGIIAEQAPRARLMILKYFDRGLPEEVQIQATVRAIIYATRMHAHIINYSAGGRTPDAREYAALQAARREGILVVAAAGNNGESLEKAGYFPATYPLDNILAVAALDQRFSLLAASNYGTSRVPIAAPGENILSAAPGGKFTTMTGTSQATARTTGIAAQLWQQRPDVRSPQLLIRQILITARLHPALRHRIGSGQVDAQRAYRLHDRSVVANAPNLAAIPDDASEFTEYSSFYEPLPRKDSTSH